MINEKTILIVDDNLVLLKALSMKLRSHGYHVLTAPDTASAIGMVRRNKPDLLILDVNFPTDSWDGFGLINWLRRMDQGRDVPVVIISGSDAGNYHERCLECGARGFFLKPIDHQALLATLRDALGQGAPEQKLVELPPELPDNCSTPRDESGPRRILMVEDDLSLGETLELFLDSEGFQVTRVTDGTDGLREIRTTDFDIILCDMVTPRMPGDQFFEAVKEVKPELCRRFLFMTGHQADPRSDAFIRRVHALMLWKPFPLCDLLTALQVVWRKSGSKPAAIPAPRLAMAAAR